MDKSLSNSQQSNFFIYSSDSSRQSPKHNISKQKYAIFTKKIKKLLDTSGDDLDELYRKIQIIVSKYFNDNKIVEFKDMYEHISTLKFNNKRMDYIVNILQKKILTQKVLKTKPQVSQQDLKYETQIIKNNKNIKNFFKDVQYETTSSSQKQSNKQKKKQTQQSSFDDLNKNKQKINESNLVITSLKQNNIISNYQQFKHSQQRKIQKQEQFSKKRQQSQQQSTNNDYHNQLVSNLDSFQIRNKGYEEKIKILMKQLQDIKMIASKSISHDQNVSKNINYRQQSIQEPINQLVDILKNNQKYQIDNLNKQTMKSTVNQMVFNNNQTLQTNIKQKNHQKKISIQSKDNNLIILNDRILKNPSEIINQTQYLISLTNSQHNNINRNISIQNQLQLSSSNKNNTKTQQKTQIINLIQSTTNLSKQIQELQQVASKLQLNSVHFIGQQSKKILQSQTELIKIDSSNNIINVQKISQQTQDKQIKKQVKRPILDQIDTANSKSYIIDDNLPSFKQLNSIKTSIQRQNDEINQKNNINSGQNQDSIIYNPFLNTISSKNTSQNFMNWPQKPQIIIPNPMKSSNSSNGFQPFKVQTIKYVYNPYQSLNISPPAKTYITYSQPSSLPNNSMIQHSSSQKSLRSSKNNIIYHLSPNSININNQRKIIASKINPNQQTYVNPNQIPFQSVKYSQNTNDNVFIKNQQQINSSNSIDLMKSSNNSIARSSAYNYYSHLHNHNYLQNGNLVRTPSIQRQNSRKSVQLSNSIQRSRNDGMNNSVRMSDSLKKRGIQLTNST